MGRSKTEPLHGNGSQGGAEKGRKMRKLRLLRGIVLFLGICIAAALIGTELYLFWAEKTQPEASAAAAEIPKTPQADAPALPAAESADLPEAGDSGLSRSEFFKKCRLPLCILLGLDILSLLFLSIWIKVGERPGTKEKDLDPMPGDKPLAPMDDYPETQLDTEYTAVSREGNMLLPMRQDFLKPVIGKLHEIGARPYQEDTLGVTLLDDGALAVVADGMGGLSGGDRVSQKIVFTMLAAGDRLEPGQFDHVLPAMIQGVNESVNQMLGPEGLYKSGSTLLAVLLRGGRFHWAAVGDSHIYFYRKGILVQLNQEHNRLQKLLRNAVAGSGSFAEARQDKKGRGLTSFIGMGELEAVEQSLRSIPLEAGDRVLLMSDGVFDAVPDAGIASILDRFPDVAQAARVLGETVKRYGNPRQDNYTAIILGV